MARRGLLSLALLLSLASLSTAQVNVARGKPANASSEWPDYPAHTVTDGQTTWNVSACYHTADDVTTSWLRVHLGAVYPMTNIVIYYRSEFSVRFVGTTINILNSTEGPAQNCTAVTDGDLNQTTLTGNFSCSTSGSIVELRRAGDYQNICEVQVWAPECPANTYGSTCTPCGHCLNGAVCDKTHGACPGGCDPGWTGTKCDAECSSNCAPRTCAQNTGDCTGGCVGGWWGTKCDQQCEAGRFGAGCAGMCGHCPCDHVTGACPGACDSGWEGSLCNQTCQIGSYGAGCRQTCGQCLQGTCHHVTGECTGGCQSGWRGSKCDQKCPDGTYGDSCASHCGQCQNKPCHHVNGSCFGGCVSGKTGDLCKDVCPRGTFGIGCGSSCGKCLNVACLDDGTCPGPCQDGWRGTMCQQTCSARQYGTNCSNTCGSCRDNAACNHVTGNCPAGCSAGWEGTRCLQDCNDGTYGEGCTLTCGNCAGGKACDKANGTCYACQKGFVPPLCQQDIASEYGWLPGGSAYNQVLGTGIGIGVGVACLLAVIVVASICLWRRRHPGRDNGQSRQNEKLGGESRGKDNSVYYSTAQEMADPGDNAPYQTLDAATRNKDAPNLYEEIGNNHGRV